MRRDDPDVYSLKPSAPLPAPAGRIVELLGPKVTPERLARFREVASRRTRAFIPVLDGLTDPHNVSAVLRSADAFGIQEVHLIHSDRSFVAAHRVARGSHQWLSFTYHRDGHGCLEHLHGQGYRVWVASMDGDKHAAQLGEAPTAVVFGNERRGPRKELVARADGRFSIPMSGFVESLNVSVAAAVTMHAASQWHHLKRLSDADQQELVARYLLESVRDAHLLVEKALRTPQAPERA